MAAKSSNSRQSLKGHFPDVLTLLDSKDKESNVTQPPKTAEPPITEEELPI